MMGEAKRRAAAREKLKTIMEQVALPRLASAMRWLATAASENLGSDCYIHATIAQALLVHLGVETKIVVGYASWRVPTKNFASGS